MLLVAGGTAGHVYPALALAEELGREGAAVALAGSPGGFEEEAAATAGLEFLGIRARGWDRSSVVSLLAAAGLMSVSLTRAVGLVRRWRPEVVVAFGGYVSLPVGLAARSLRVPLVLHEQNSVPGLANRVLARRADRIAVTFEDSIGRLPRPERALLTGNPVRSQILQARRDDARDRLGLRDGARVLLVFGGSQGAKHLNEAMLRIADDLMGIQDVVVLHVTGKRDHSWVADALADLGLDPARWLVREYIQEMGDALAASDLVVCRAGATSVAEVCAAGRASVLVPYPFATEDHQTLNARSLEKAGAAVVVPDTELDAPGFAQTVAGLLRDEERLEEMGSAARRLAIPDAAARLAAVVRDAGGATTGSTA